MGRNRLLIEKNELRAAMRSRIKSVVSSSGYSAPQAVSSVLNRLFSLSGMNDGSFCSIMIYLSLPEEFPTLAMVLDLFFREGKEENRSNKSLRNIAVPWCSGKDLQLYRLDPSAVYEKNGSVVFEEMRDGAYHILEPDEDLRERPDRKINPRDLDLILVPGLAFDPSGGRLGRGAGFYDRFLQKTREDVLLAGLAFDEQIVDSVPCEPHDRLMDLVLTPSRCIRAAKAKSQLF
ncbi:MAG: 5-formyltetrahydrofolate cyclo-ligase [Planctomycetia bacterium]|nr:5-formyltetrahydrofolate cyclo-ligase [Planctomycetia bacterium]